MAEGIHHLDVVVRQSYWRVQKVSLLLGEHGKVAPCRSASSVANACPGVLCGKGASVATCIGEAEAGGVPTCMGEALATGNPLLKLGARLAAVATLCTVVPGMVPGPVLPWGIGIVTSEAARVMADWVTRLEASCSGGRSAVCGIGVGVQ